LAALDRSLDRSLGCIFVFLVFHDALFERMRLFKPAGGSEQ